MTRLWTALLCSLLLAAGCASPTLVSPSPGLTPAPPPVATPTAAPPPTSSPAPSPTIAPTPEPGILLPGSLAVTVSDQLVVRSKPEVSTSSLIHRPYLPTGTQLVVIEGPVAGSGYRWYHVMPVGLTLDDGVTEGWVAAAGRDDTPWIAEERCNLAGEDSRSDTVLARPDGIVYVACDATGPTVVVSARDPVGTMLPGWPVTLAGSVGRPLWHDFVNVGCGFGLLLPGNAMRLPALASDGSSLFFLLNPPAPHPPEADASVVALGPDGRLRPGWPRPLPGGCPGFTLGSDGAVRAWWYEGVVAGISLDARLTRYTALAPDGQDLPGWPIGSPGVASGPVIGSDGTLYYVSARGEVFAHDLNGRVRPGWPVRLPGPVAPTLLPDGRLFFTFDDQLVALTADGDPAPGWPYRLPTHGDWAVACCGAPCLPPGVGTAAFGADGTYYAALAPEKAGGAGQVIAVDSQGGLVAGWPFPLPSAQRLPSGRQPQVSLSLSVNPNGLIVVNVSSWPEEAGCGTPEEQVITLSAAGDLVGGWPTVSRAGITMTGAVEDSGEMDGRLRLMITVSGLAPGEAVSLSAAGDYSTLWMCGRQPEPCGELGCGPSTYEEREATAKAAAHAAAGSDGTAVARIEIAAAPPAVSCPTDSTAPWSTRDERWEEVRIADPGHGLLLTPGTIKRAITF